MCTLSISETVFAQQVFDFLCETKKKREFTDEEIAFGMQQVIKMNRDATNKFYSDKKFKWSFRAEVGNLK